MPAPFDPAAYPALTELSGRLRSLSGDASYAAGRAYLQKGQVKHGAVALGGEAGVTAYATVSGSADYRVSVSLPGSGEPKVTCTCPAHRRSKYCKHVVSLCVALAERPGEFTVGEAPPEAQGPAKRAARPKAGATAGAPRAPRVKGPSVEEQRAAGLVTVDRLLEELAEGGLAGLGPDKVALLAGAADLVRALKLRRLGNLLMALRHAAERDRASLEGGGFARLLTDLYATRQATGAHLAGEAQMAPELAEDLLGKTWRDEELEQASGMALMEVGATRADDGEFRVETGYLADLATGALYAEKQITPSRLRTEPRTRHQHRVVVEHGLLFPGPAPRRLRLHRFSREALTAEGVAGLVGRTTDSAAVVRAGLVERLNEPFGEREVAVLFRPAALLERGDQRVTVDGAGEALALTCAPKWLEGLIPLLPEEGEYALFGLLGLETDGPRLRCLSAVSGGFVWGEGPVYAGPE